MKTIFIICFLLGYFVPVIFAQNEESIYGDSFIKRVEYNFLNVRLAKKGGDELVMSDYYKCNSGSKSDVEKLFFGDFNARVEFFYEPSFESSTGFRIRKDSSNTSYILEVKHISNYDEVFRDHVNKHPVIDIPENIMDSIPFEFKEIIWNHLKAKQYEERLKLFQIETRCFPISDQFAEKLYQKMVLFIDNFKVKGRLLMTLDGYSVTFRNVVDDEVWSLKIHQPKGNALKLADICRQIITDADANKLNELMYISVLNEFKF